MKNNGHITFSLLLIIALVFVFSIPALSQPKSDSSPAKTSEVIQETGDEQEMKPATGKIDEAGSIVGEKNRADWATI
jgi:hypothetical protein